MLGLDLRHRFLRVVDAVAGTVAFRLGYVSLVTPDSVYDCDTVTGELTMLRRRPVLPL